MMNPFLLAMANRKGGAGGGGGIDLGAREETVEVTWVEETVLTNGSPTMNSIKAYKLTPQYNSVFNGDDKIIVVFAGKTYGLYVKTHPLEDSLYVGNVYMWGLKEGAPTNALESLENTGEPFFIDLNNNNIFAENDRYEGSTIEIKKEETTITPIDEKWLPSTGGVTSWNDLEDRPFYTNIIEEEELLPEQTLKITSTKLDPDPVYDELLSKCTAGDKLLVTINGESTETEVRTYTEGTVSINYIGNLSVYGTGNNTGEPFLIAKTASDETAFLQYPTLAKGNYTIRVVKISKEIVPIPKELLPAGVGGGAFVVDLLTEDGNNFTMVQDYKDVFNASLVGPVVGIVNIGGAMVFHLQFAIATDNMLMFYGPLGGSGMIAVQIDGTTKTGTAQTLS